MVLHTPPIIKVLRLGQFVSLFNREEYRKLQVQPVADLGDVE